MANQFSRFLLALPALIGATLATVLAGLAITATDLFWLILGGKRRTADTLPGCTAASLVIPNWNGRDLLERFLPSWLSAIENHPGSEVLVVDNGSTDGSADWIRANYPQVHLLALPQNLGFGGGSNAGFRAAKNDIVVLLNSDMRVEPDFLAPLLDGFIDEKVFAVSCQIFLGDPTKRREETGLTEARWRDGNLQVAHREDAAVDRLFPCFYGGGGSCAFDRRKFFELGGFDELLRPFYLEDTDLGFLAWKRGWKVLYQPASVVHHEHRGTIGKEFTQRYIGQVLSKNFVLFAWKNIHEPRRLASHFFFSLAGCAISAWSGPAPGRANAGGVLRAILQLPGALRSRWRARSLAVIGDTETFRRPRPSYFHDRFSHFDPRPARPRVLFVSPYAIAPPTHGGGVFMYYMLRQLARWCEVHVIVMLDTESERAAHDELRRFCASVEMVVRTVSREPHLASITPHAVQEFHTRQTEWLVERETLLHRVDVIQLEYTALGQYAHPYRNLVCALFEHDVYFQSVGRALDFVRSPLDKVKARFEYLRAIRFELRLLPNCDHIQVCTAENKAYLESFLPNLAPRIESGLRAGIDTSLYPYPGGPRRPLTLLFLGSFRHTPNQIAMEWFTRDVMPHILRLVPQATLVVAGSDPPPRHAFGGKESSIELLGFVPDIQPLLSSCALFVCPILNGSGVRVKLLEAFASGIPVVSTTVGAEGLAREDGEFCALADDAESFARKVSALLQDENAARQMAERARCEVEHNWDMAVIGRKLADRYQSLITPKRKNGLPGDPLRPPGNPSSTALKTP
jgi:GT2 family glycosyltransferase